MLIGPGITLGPGITIDATATPVPPISGALLDLDAATGISGSSWINTGSLGSSLNYALQNSPGTTTINGYTVLTFAGGAGQAPGSMTNQYAFNSTGFGTALDSASGFTLDIWASPQASTDAGCLIKEWGQGSANVPLQGWEDSWISFSGGNIQVGYWINVMLTGNAGAFSSGSWYNIVMSYNGVNGAAVYVNGSNTLNLSGIRAAPTTGNTMFSVAACERFNYQGTTRYFEGYVGAFKVYSTALNSTQVTQNFNALRGRYGV